MPRGLGLIWGFLSPETRHRIQEQERGATERRIARGCVPWDPEKTKFDKFLVLDGNTFKPKPLFDIAPVNLYVHGSQSDPKHHVVSPDGTMAYRNALLPRGSMLDLWQGAKRGKVVFSTDVVIPTLAKWPDPGYHNAWMSYTPAEVLSMRQGVRLARGKCVVGGLGMGYFLGRIAQKRVVKEIVVVEKSQSLLDWYGRELCQRLAGETGKPITVICGDAIEELGKHGEETRYLYDIWDSFPVDLYGKEAEAVATVKHFWGWGCLAESAWRD